MGPDPSRADALPHGARIGAGSSPPRLGRVKHCLGSPGSFWARMWGLEPGRDPGRLSPPPAIAPCVDSLSSRQWPEVYDFCHTFLHVARVQKHTDMRESHAKPLRESTHTHTQRESHAFRGRFLHVRVFFD